MIKKSFLIITNYFPPTSHIAAFRLQAYARYLNNEKLKVFVLTPWNPVNGPFQEKMMIENCEVHFFQSKTRVLDLNIYKAKSKLEHYLLVIKNKINFNLFLDEDPDFTNQALNKAKSFIEKENIRYLLTSYGPASPVICGVKLKEKFPHLTWFSDLRDEMSEAVRIGPLLRFYLRRLEKKMVETADYVVSVSAPILENLIGYEKYKSKFIEIRNGFDFDPIKENPLRIDDIFYIAYAGSFYGEIKPHNFFKAIELFKLKHSSIKIILRIYGGNAGLEIPESIKDNIEVKARVSHSAMIEELQKAHAFLLIYPSDKRKGVYTGKLYDYLAVNRPIIGLVNPQDVAAQLLQEASAGYICDNADIEGVVKILEKVVADYKNINLPERNWKLIENFQRKNQVEKINQIIEQSNQPIAQEDTNL